MIEVVFLSTEQFKDYLHALCAERAGQVESVSLKPIHDYDYGLYQVLRANGVLEEITNDQLVVDATIDTCGDDERVWECYKHFRKTTSQLRGEPSRFFPFSAPGGPLLAHPAISELMGHDYYGQLVQKLLLTYIAKGHTVYKPVAHAPCGVAGLLELTLDKVVQSMIELCELLEKEVGEHVPNFKARPLLHVDRRGHVEHEHEWMRTYRIIPARFYLWREAGSPMSIDTASA